MRRPAPAYTLSLALALALATAGCDSPTEVDPDELEPTLSSIQQNIFNTTCAISGCHAGAQAQEGLDLTANNAHSNLVGVASQQVPDLMRVEAGNPGDSYLVIKLEGGPEMAPGSARMPFQGTPLSAEVIDVIRQWIAEGAEAN